VSERGQRARRRAEREVIAEAERRRRARALARRRRWAAVSRAMPFRRAGSTHRTALGTHRGRQNGILLAALLSAHTVLWLLEPSWWLRASAAVLTVLAWPVLVVLLFDRRSPG